MTVNTIRRSEVGEDLWYDIVRENDPIDWEKEHRRGSNFYTNWVLEIDEQNAPDNPELWGFWMTNTFIWDDDYGPEWSEIDTLDRVEKQTKIVETVEWVAVKREVPAKSKAKPNITVLMDDEDIV